MVKVYIWLPHADMFGHASLLCQDTYMSWWPDEGRIASMPSVVTDTLPKTRNIYAASPIRERSYIDDMRAERREPDTISLTGLNENAILSWWSSFGLVMRGQQLSGPLPPWKTLTQNCSTVVAKALAVGGGDKYAGMYSSWSIVWRPQTVKEYAEAIASTLKRKR